MKEFVMVDSLDLWLFEQVSVDGSDDSSVSRPDGSFTSDDFVDPSKTDFYIDILVYWSTELLLFIHHDVLHKCMAPTCIQLTARKQPLP